jgi:FdhD protein
MKTPGKKVLVTKWKPDIYDAKDDLVAIEEPLQLMLNGVATSITMRTPGDDKALALGFFSTEGVIKHFQQIKDVVQVDENTVNVLLENQSENSFSTMQRNFYTTSSCGVCGKTSVESIFQKTPYDIKKQNFEVSPSILLHLQDKLFDVQTAFQATGGIHAAVLFSSNGHYQYHSEDVGRHNALDKLIGHSMMADKLPLSDQILLLSGRASFELIQKAAMAGISFVCAVGAPSSLAIELAEEIGITLVGFLKKSSFNIYTHGHRIHV